MEHFVIGQIAKGRSITDLQAEPILFPWWVDRPSFPLCSAFLGIISSEKTALCSSQHLGSDYLQWALKSPAKTVLPDMITLWQHIIFAGRSPN